MRTLANSLFLFFSFFCFLPLFPPLLLFLVFAYLQIWEIFQSRHTNMNTLHESNRHSSKASCCYNFATKESEKEENVYSSKHGKKFGISLIEQTIF
jgi:hypothetical protein